MQNTDNIEKTTTRIVQQIAESQHRAYGAFADNFFSFQRRNVGFAQGWISFLKLQESNAKAVHDLWIHTLQGPQGEPGPQGETGETGPEGPSGPNIDSSYFSRPGTMEGPVTTGVNPLHGTGNIERIMVALAEAPTGSSMIASLRLNDDQVQNIEVPDGADWLDIAGLSIATEDGDRLTCPIVQVGSDNPGSYLTVKVLRSVD
jgi:hypothetical protein